MTQAKNFDGISVSYDNTKIIDWNTWTEFELRPWEKIIDKNIIWSDGKTESTVPQWLVEIMRDYVREVLDLQEYTEMRYRER